MTAQHTGIRVEIIEHIEKEWWNTSVASAGGEFHQTMFYADFCKHCLQKRPYYLIAWDQDVPVGIAMFFLEGYAQDFVMTQFPSFAAKLLIWGLQTFWNCCTLIHGPLILDPSREQEVLAQLILGLEQFARTKKIFLWKKVMPPIHQQTYSSSTWDQVFTQYGFERQPWATLLVDLQVSQDVLLKSFKNSARKAIRKIEKQDVEFIRVEDEEALRRYYNVLSETRERKGLQLGIRYELLRDWWKTHADVFQVFLVEHQGQPLAGQGMFLFNGMMREVFAGTSNYASEKKMYGGDLLKFEIFKWGQKHGYHLYDLAGVHPNPTTTSEKNIRQFKEKWGGKYIPYSVYSKVYGRVRYQVLNKFRKQTHE